MTDAVLIEPQSRVHSSPPSSTEVEVYNRFDAEAVRRWNLFLADKADGRTVHRAEWAEIFRQGLGHQPKFLEATENGRIVGVMPLVFMKSLLFGRFLVSSPYVNVGGPVAIDETAAHALIARAVALADEFDVKHLELRNTREFEHPALAKRQTEKKLMVKPLPSTTGELLRSYKSEFRSKVLRGERNGVAFAFGRENLLDDFYDVFAVNMRDLGTPVFGKALFQAILERLGDDAELCVGRLGGKAVSAALIWHGPEGTEVPSSSTLREVNRTGANMSLFGKLLQRAVERGSKVFDFGRSSEGSGTYTFKRNWGAEPKPSVWQYYVRKGDVTDVRPENPRYRRKIELWKKLPVWITRLVGPTVVRGIP
jgi:serine/alanine adding enzyme